METPQRISSRTVVIGLAVGVFLVTSVLPVAYLLVVALTTAEGYSSVLLDARQRGLLVNTALLGGGTALLATAIGSVLGFALARMSLSRKSLLRVALATPLVLPPYVVGLAWTYAASASAWTYSLPAAILVLSLVFYPIAMLATEAALRAVDGRLEEAGLIVAPPARVLRRITLPLAAPAMLSAALMIFVFAISEFGVPGLLQVRVYTTEVFTAFAALYDVSRAVLLAVPLLLLCIVTAVASALLGERLLVTRRVSGIRPVLFDAWRRPAAALAVCVLIGALVVPLVMLLAEALGGQSSASALPGAGEAIVNSVWLAIVGATIVVTVALGVGYARARSGGRVGFAADTLFLAMFGVPSTIVGVGLIAFWNREGPLGTLYGTDAMILVGYVARFVPVVALALAVTTRYVPRSHEEASAVSGAGWLRTMWRIVLPQMRIGLLAAWVLAFVLAFGELGVSILVAPPGEATLPIRVYTLIANTPSSHVAALALLQSVVILGPLAGLAVVVSRAETR
jgi:iron(III) transport system permease protein